MGNDGGSELGSELDISVSDFDSSSFFASTPRGRRSTSSRGKARPSRSKTGPFNQPNFSAVLATCPTCKKPYKSLAYYKKHLQTHLLIDSAAKTPDLNVLLSSVKTLGHAALKQLQSNPAVGKYGQEYNNLVSKLIESEDSDGWQAFVTFVGQQFTLPIQDKKIILPSSIFAFSLKDVERMTSKMEVRMQCVELLNVCCSNCEISVMSTFLLDFLFAFCDQFLILLSKTIRGPDIPCQDKFVFDQSERQTIHFVAGSVIKGFVRFARRHPKNLIWRCIVEALRDKIIENPETLPASSEDKAWTEVLNRGSLTFVNKDALDFFIAVATILKKQEYQDARALPHEKILNAVFTGEALYIWDSLLGTSLSEDLSLTLLKGVSKSFTHTYGRGVVLKKMNAASRNNPKAASTTLRQSLAPR